jgi:hypothetical protein
MVVFGGMNGKQNFNDLSVYSIRTLAPLVADLARHCVAQLLRHDTTRHTTPSRSHTNAHITGLTLGTNRWTVVSIDGDVPAERRAHSAVISSGGHLCIFGGSDGAKRFDDIYSFDLSGSVPCSCLSCAVSFFLQIFV